MRYRTCNWGPSCNDYKITRYIFDILDRNADCPFPCVINGHHFCRPPPCPVPACRDPISIPGQCCGTCPEDCPKGTCKIGNKTACYPSPVPFHRVLTQSLPLGIAVRIVQRVHAYTV